MSRSTHVLIVAAVLVAGAVPASAGPRPVANRVAEGYDLFVTPDGGGEVSIDAGVAGVPVMTFRGRPLGSFTFPGKGTHRVGAADTIVRRLDTATPSSPKVRIELVGLLLESTNVPGYFVTLQSARPLGLPSTGTLEFQFDRKGLGGLLRSELLVNYDVRHGTPTGPIVASGSTGMGFVAENVLWRHTRDSSDQPQRNCVDLGGGRYYCITAEGTFICHEAGLGAPHLHCVEIKDGAVPLLKGINHLLNGSDTSEDFVPLGIGEPRSAS